eukprot:s4938_g5.t1
MLAYFLIFAYVSQPWAAESSAPQIFAYFAYCVNLHGQLRAHHSKPLLWQHPRVVPTPLTFSSLLLWATLGGQVSTLPLGNFGRSSEHIASQVVTKYCQSGNISLPEPYFADIPVCVKTSDDWTLSVKPVAMYLPHEWFAWLEMEEQAAGFDCLEEFWRSHNMEDPKLDGNPVADEPQKFLPLILHGDGGAFQKSDSIIVLSMRFGASSVKPTGLLALRLPHFSRDLYAKALPEARRPESHAIGMDSDGQFKTSSHKEYPPALSAGLANVIAQQLQRVCRGQSTHLTASPAPTLCQWISDVSRACAMIRQSAAWLPDYQG